MHPTGHKKKGCEKHMSYLVIKCGGSVMDQLPASFFDQLVQLVHQGQVKPILVHGGGPDITKLLNELNIESKFVNGLRVTTEQTLDVVEMVLSGKMNKSFVRNIIANGGKAVGLSGADGKLLEATPINPDLELGYVGKIAKVNNELLIQLSENQIIPVISPIGIDQSGQRWNINGDLAAAAIAKELHAPLWVITNVDGVMKENNIIHHLQISEATSLIENKVITGGMIPKVKAAIDCIQSGVKEVLILNGIEENILLKIMHGEKLGTKILEGITC